MDTRLAKQDDAAHGHFRFGGFCLDIRDRQLWNGEKAVDLNSRYLDALILMVNEDGRLVSKDRFLEEVWRGVPVTDEALTQCIRTLRRQLGDDASRPRFIETVPKHGYRFIAPVDTTLPGPSDETRPASPRAWRDVLVLAGAGAIGAGFAGLAGGLIYGFAGASQPLQPGMGSISVLLVLVCLSILVAIVAGAGVSLGIAVAGFLSGRLSPWAITGGGAGGLVVGAVVKLLGLDAFNLLLGRSPGDIAGSLEGLLLGGAVGLGAWLVSRGTGRTVGSSAAIAGLAGAAGGIAIALAGGRLMGGSLDSLARNFPGSRLDLGKIGAAFGENGLGPISRTVTGALEGFLFAAGIVGAMILAWRSLDDGDSELQ